MFFKPYYLGCLAHASYLIGGDNGDAAVIDPRRDVDEYLTDANNAGLTIKYVIETHLHADFVSGHVEMAQRTGAAIILGGATPVDFPHRAVREGEEIVLGDVRLRFLETPGHTPEGISILALPAFVYAAGLPIKSSVATSLAVVGATSLIGAILAKRRCSTHGCPGQEVDGGITALMTAGGLTGAFLGARLSAQVPAETQMLLFGLVMLGAAAGMLRRRPLDPHVLPAREAVDASSPPRLLVLPLGLGVGLLTGGVGVGGGFLIVPALTLMARVPVKRAAAMSLWIIAANSAAGLTGYLGHVPIAWGAAGMFLVFALLGLVVGQRLATRVQPQGLQRAFAVFLVLVGCFTLFKTQFKTQTAPVHGAPSNVVYVAPSAVSSPRADSPKQ